MRDPKETGPMLMRVDEEEMVKPSNMPQGSDAQPAHLSISERDDPADLDEVEHWAYWV